VNSSLFIVPSKVVEGLSAKIASLDSEPYLQIILLVVKGLKMSNFRQKHQQKTQLFLIKDHFKTYSNQARILFITVIVYHVTSLVGIGPG